MMRAVRGVESACAAVGWDAPCLQLTSFPLLLLRGERVHLARTHEHAHANNEEDLVIKSE